MPTVLVTALTPLAESIGVNRIVHGKAVTNPFGDPDLPPESEVQYRRRVVQAGLDALSMEVSGPTVFEPEVAADQEAG